MARVLTAVVRSSGGRVKAIRTHGERSPETESSRPGTSATPRRSAAWANPPESTSPGRRAQTLSPPAGCAQVQPGRYAVSAADMAAHRCCAHADR